MADEAITDVGPLLDTILEMTADALSSRASYARLMAAHDARLGIPAPPDASRS